MTADQLLAKSPARGARTLADHSLGTLAALYQVRARLADAGILAGYPRFWEWAAVAALLHDPGKAAPGFQRQLTQPGAPWGHRHELLSLAFATDLLRSLSEEDLGWIAAGIATHHRHLHGNDRALSAVHPFDDGGKEFRSQFGCAAGGPLTATEYAAVASWYHRNWPGGLPRPEAPTVTDPRELAYPLYERFGNRFEKVRDPDDALVAVLLQGVVTLADRCDSSRTALDGPYPLNGRYLTERFTDPTRPPHAHQEAAAGVDGHMLLTSPTGSGKTESGLAWAGAQSDRMPGEPRLWWVLPYRASLNAMHARFRRHLGLGLEDVGLLHSSASRTLLSWIAGDDTCGNVEAARKAAALNGAARLYRQRIRVATPHQLVKGLSAGPANSSVLAEQANSVIVLDELHAYDPAYFGWICALMRLWERLGSRIAVVTATLAPPMKALIEESLVNPLHYVQASTPLPPRHIVIPSEQPLLHPDTLNRIADDVKAGHTVLVVANTVDTARRAHAELSERSAGVCDPDRSLLLHSRFRHADRQQIEDRILTLFPEREDGTPRQPGFLVATQTVEVSLQLDFDRGYTENAPVESVAQRIGRVNRRGLHPDGSVPVVVCKHDPGARPYTLAALDAAWEAITATGNQPVTEATIQGWLDHAYATEWGQSWSDTARRERDRFTEAWLDFSEPYTDRSRLADTLDQQFDTIEAVTANDLDEYKARLEEHPLTAGDLLIPLRVSQIAQLAKNGLAVKDKATGTWVVHTEYDNRTGLSFNPIAERDTIL